MGIRSILAKPFAAFIAAETKRWSREPEVHQAKIMEHLVDQARETAFGKDHSFGSIKDYETFKKHVPIRDYEELKPYIERVVAGEADILWKGKPKYLAKTSGTTSGTKYIPITKDSVSSHFANSRNAVLSYVHETGKASFLDGNIIFLS